MTTNSINPKNERLKRSYRTWLKESDRKAEATVRAAEHYLRQFEILTDFADFASFDGRQAVAFKKSMAEAGLSAVTRLRTVNELKRFFRWLQREPGYRSKIDPNDIDFLNLSAHDARIATSRAARGYATLDQVKAAIAAMPTETEVQRRDRAVFAFIVVTQMRDRAVASLRLKHIDLDRRLVHQDPREVRTKFRKPIETFMLPIDAEIERIVVEWIEYLIKVRHFGMDDPVFPRTAAKLEAHSFVGIEVEPVTWETAGPTRSIFKRAYAAAGIEYFPPHTMRHTITHAVLQQPLTPEQLKAFAQNLGHESPTTTITAYGHVPTLRQGEIVRMLRVAPAPQDDPQELLRRLQAAMARQA